MLSQFRRSSAAPAPPAAGSSSGSAGGRRRALLPRAPRAVQQQAEGAPPQQQQEEQQEEQQGAPAVKLGGFTRSRARRNVAQWQDEATPNIGLVQLTARSSVGGAAACVASDLQAQRLTRVVASTRADIERAVATVRLAAAMLSTRAAAEGEDGAAADQPTALVFQPVEVMGALVAPPELPEGATVLYTQQLPVASPVLQDVLRQHAHAAADAAAAAAASAAAAAAGASGGDAQQQAGGSGFKPRVFVGRSTTPRNAARGITGAIRQLGWAELVCVGRQDQSLATGMEAVVRARRWLHGQGLGDAAVFPLDDTGTALAGKSLPRRAPGTPRPPCAFLVVRCAKNAPHRLGPLAAQAADAQ